LKISFLNTCTVLVFFIAGLLFLRLERVIHRERIASRWRPAFSSHLVSSDYRTNARRQPYLERSSSLSEGPRERRKFPYHGLHGLPRLRHQKMIKKKAAEIRYAAG
jgi:hypothetical protein